MQIMFNSFSIVNIYMYKLFLDRGFDRFFAGLIDIKLGYETYLFMRVIMRLNYI